MTNLTPIKGSSPPVLLDELPQRRHEECLEDLARELMTVAALLRSAELRSEPCTAEIIERAKHALQCGVAAQMALRTACQPANLAEIGERINALIESIPHGEPADGYSTALTMDVCSLQPSRGALEVACRGLRTTAMFRPKIPEVLEAVREAGLMYEAARSAIDKLPGRIVSAEQVHAQRGSSVMTLSVLDADEREDLRLSAIARFVEREIGEEAFRLELARCGLPATEIDQVVNDHRRERRRGTPFE